MNRKQYILALVAMAGMTLPNIGLAATPDDRDVVKTQDGSIIVNTFNNCVRTMWVNGVDECAPPAVARLPRRALAQEERTVYFGFNKATLSDEAKAKLNTLANTLKSDKEVTGARIAGYADRIGSAAYNEQLSQKRADAVKEYLTSRGYVNTQVTKTRWLGESEPVTNCPDNLSREELINCLQQDRRVEVEIDYLPEGTTYERR